MTYRDDIQKLNAHRAEITTIRAKIRAIQSRIEPQPVKDYTFATLKGEVTLSALFGDKKDLFMVHNMGAGCPYCTLWADGYNGVYPHLTDRAAFVVSSPDSPKTQARFSKIRGWKFPMVSHAGSTFAADMGFANGKGGFNPGISAFKKTRGKIVRVSDYSGMGPGDDFCSVWHFLDMLPEGAAGWRPKFKYAA
jgi:predicted dithiol-disulfide oxidoreductase (DUF899 family)